MSFCKDENNKPKISRWKAVLITSFVLLAIIIIAVVIYEKWCEAETKPLLNRIEQITNHKIKVDSSAGEEYRFSINLTANEDEVFSKSSIRVSYILLLGNSGKIKLNWINEYKESNSENLHTIITQIVLYIARINDQWVIKDMMALA